MQISPEKKRPRSVQIELSFESEEANSDSKPKVRRQIAFEPEPPMIILSSDESTPKSGGSSPLLKDFSSGGSPVGGKKT